MAANRSHRARRGIALVLTSWLVILLSLWGVLLLRESMVANAASGNAIAKLKARLACDSALESALVFLATPENRTGKGELQPWADPTTAASLAKVPVDTGGLVWAACVATDPNTAALRYGLDDEASKLHLGVATKEMLEKLPGMTAELAAAIIDWRDEDQETTADGAEDEVYALLPGFPYTAKNAPFETLYELLLVRGIDPAQLFGEDQNQNGRLDLAENDGDEKLPVDDSDGVLATGLFSYLTLHAYEPNLKADGAALLDLNTASQEQLQQELGALLSPEQIQQIMMLRSAGGLQSVGALAALPQFTPDALKAIVDLVTVYAQTQVVGRVNVVTAPRAVLLALPGMTEERVDALLAYRAGRTEGLDSLAWVVDAIGMEGYSAVSNWVTVHSYQFRFQVQGHVGGTTAEANATAIAAGTPVFRAYHRRSYVVDVAGETPTVLHQRDLDRHGPVRLPESQ